jgi:TolB-like protein
LIIGVLALAVVVLLVDKVWLSGAGDGAPEAVAEVDKSVAVLPFADLSQNQDQEWFADGLAEEILNALARTPDLLISARTSTFAYKGTDKDIPTIAKELGVAHVLEGSVRRAGERIRVTAQLIRAVDGFHLWSQNYDRDATDIIEIQEDLAIQIANALETTMDPESLTDMVRVGTSSVEAYQAYIHSVALLARSLLENERQMMC